jgi:hypothetical protein
MKFYEDTPRTRALTTALALVSGIGVAVILFASL